MKAPTCKISKWKPWIQVSNSWMEEDVKSSQENDGSILRVELIFRPNQFPNLSFNVEIQNMIWLHFGKFQCNKFESPKIMILLASWIMEKLI